MESPSKIILSASTVFYLLSSSLMAMVDELDISTAVVGVKPSAAAASAPIAAAKPAAAKQTQTADAKAQADAEAAEKAAVAKMDDKTVGAPAAAAGAGAGAAAAVVRQEEGIYKVNDGFYVGKRRKDRDLHFVISRVTPENLPVWEEFEKGQAAKCLKIWDELTKDKGYSEHSKATQKFLAFINVTRPSGRPSIQAGLMAFKETLRIYKEYKSEVWIAYALAGEKINPLQPITQGMFPHIEMAMTVLTAPEAPMTVHMGIARSVYHEEMAFQQKLPKHNDLAIPLHAFAAQAMKMRDSKKIWMRTCPAWQMEEILDKALPQGSYLKGRDKLLEAFRWNESNSAFEIYDKAGRRVLSASKQMVVDWHWYFNHFYLSPPMTDYAIDINVLGQQFDKGVSAQADGNPQAAVASSIAKKKD